MESKTKRIKLAELTIADLENIHKLHSLPETDEYNTLGIPATMNSTDILLREWLSQQQQMPRSSYIFCIRQVATNRFIGLIALMLGKVILKLLKSGIKRCLNIGGKG